MANERSLKTVFREADELYQSIESSSLSSNDPALQKDIARALQCFQDCSSMVRSLSIFSSNEVLDDINTSDLRYLLVDFYIGVLYQKIVGGDRIDHLKGSLIPTKSALESFLFRCDTHEILAEEDKRHMASVSANVKLDAEKQRGAKIARYKREKAMRTQLEELRARMPKDADDESVDEELLREALLTTLQLSIQKAMEEMRSAMDEVALLEAHRAKGATGVNVEDIENRLDRLDVSKPTALLSKDGKPLQPFIITSRKDLLSQVFRPGHNLPTMSIDQFLENEIARGNFLQGGTERPEKPEADDNDEAAVDAATMKARDFDNFRDENPRGWGNRMNKG
ncbi:hypothetical protein HK101_011225 [Irineochytrium annulatum]|nr:hypothetical protein HK101_011225 [Irineochytrium annulatum]